MWKENKVEHSELWKSATYKIVKSLDKTDFQIAGAIFSDQFNSLLSSTASEKMQYRAFFAWLFLSYNKENMPIIEWFIKKHGSQLSQEEKEVLLAAKEKQFGVFKVEEQTKDCLKLLDTRGKSFFVETIDMPEIKTGIAAFAQIASKGDNKYFAPGVIAPWENDLIFQNLKKINKFHDSWNNVLEGFFKYLVKEYNLSEKTADKHTENANLMLIFLENETSIDSFEKITKPMLKTPFQKFTKHHILNKVDIEKVYYSLNRFFDYLAEEKQIKNPEILNWLKNR